MPFIDTLAKAAAFVVCRLLTIRLPGGRRSRKRYRSLLYHRIAKFFMRQNQLANAKLFVSMGTTQIPGDRRLNKLSLRLARKGATPDPVAKLSPQIESFCLFLGYPGSGHSIIGALLDAHPEMVISNEIHVLKLLKAGLPAERLFKLIAENARTFAFTGRHWSGNRYAVPGQWQGCYRRLRVIGDKKGSGTAAQLNKDPDLLKTLRDQIAKPLRIIHVYRNPYDNIATLTRRGRNSIDAATNRYFGVAESVCATRSLLDEGTVFDLKQELLIEAPQDTVAKLCRFLSVPAPEDYLEACSGILFKSPHQSRNTVTWTDQQIAQVRKRISDYPWLGDYEFQV